MAQRKGTAMDLSKLIEALDCEATKPKELGAYNTVENVWEDLADVDNKVEKEKPHGNRKSDKEKLEVSKECGECGKIIKKAKKALMLFCFVPTWPTRPPGPL